MASYTYEAFYIGDLNRFKDLLEQCCDNGHGRVVASNAVWDSNENQVMFYGLVQVYSDATDNPDSEVIYNLEQIKSNTDNITS